MSRVGWATVIGCVFGVLLFGMLQRGCDVDADSGVVVLPREEAPAPAPTAQVAPAPAPAPGRGITGPTTRPQGTPQRMQIAAQRAAEERRNGGASSQGDNTETTEWLRQQREEALANRQRAMEIARGMRATSPGNTDQPTRPLGQNTTNPEVPSGGAVEYETAEYVPRQYFPNQSDVVFPQNDFGQFRRPTQQALGSESGEEGADTALTGEDLGGSDAGLAGGGGGGSFSVRGLPVQNGGNGNGNGNGSGNGNGNGDGNGNGNGSGNGDGGNGDGGTPAQPPGVPALSAPAQSASGLLPSLTLTWGAATRASTYTVQVSTSAEFASLAFTQAGVSGTTLAIPAGRLSAGTTYFWRVIALNGAGQTPSTVRTFATLGGPGAFSIESPANNGPAVTAPVTLRWGASPNATAYSVVVASDQAFTQIVATATNITDTSFAIPADVLEEGADYWWRVIASNPAASALASPATARFSVLGAPGVFTLVSPIDNAVDQFVPTPLAWSPSRFATSYRVEVATDESFTNIVVNRDGLTATTLVLMPGEIEQGRMYWWRVTARNELDFTGSTQVFSFTTAPLPGEFSLTSPADNANVGAPVTLRWSESERALLYVVQVARDEAMTDLVVDEFVIPLLTGETAFAIPDGVLETGESYFWRIEAQNEVGVREAATPVFRFAIRTTDFDLNGDGVVDIRDLYEFHAQPTAPDLNLDGQGNNDDRLALRSRIRENEKAGVSAGRSN